MRSIAIAGALAALLVTGGAAFAQQPETGPGTDAKGHPIRGKETGTRGPSGTSPDTGYHGPRDVTKDSEPGKAKSPEELRRSGQSPEKPASKQN
jgi:hypothetical protein